ncbi:hypothetical protein COUCH_23770 [Couchioplanes caeruleus]|uniref:hypothetical protein n=1 Tax=Couchioplanes caeruleus TaxID=56438 RepID=UPI0020BF2307|nr:hypothetical protein [Couchioplanes caeruleus]UQU62055.1 hypothetical protein COUCH_23770 [Couchioplanes caeruleus]
MANSARVYQRETTGGHERVTIMAYLGADDGDADEIRRIVERDGTVVEDTIAYFGTAGEQWLREQDDGYRAAGFRPGSP